MCRLEKDFAMQNPQKKTQKIFKELSQDSNGRPS
jgi:hypothetical protein